jgi:hypothetical protein
LVSAIPKNPPTFATELIGAIPPVAAAPLGNAVDNVQNVGSILITPIWARQSPSKKLFNVHFRNIRGRWDDFQEV